MQRIVTPLYRLSRAYSYFYGNRLTINDREYLERLVLTIYNRQSEHFFSELFNEYLTKWMIYLRFYQW